MNNNDNKVSIIMPTYNRSNIVGNAIQSVINQTYTNWEFIIIDDGSTDETGDVIASFKDPRIQYQKNKENKGANHARNIGLNLSCGKFVAFIDSDNVWISDKLEKQVHVMEHQSKELGIVYSAFLMVDGVNKAGVYIPKKDISIHEKEEDILSTLLFTNIIDTNTVLVRKECFNAVGGFDEEFPRFQDWEMFFRIILKSGYKVKFIDEPLTYNYRQSDSLSHDDEKLIIARALFLKKYFSEYMQRDKIEDAVMSFIETPIGLIYANKRLEEIRDILKNHPNILINVLEKVYLKEISKKEKFKNYYNLLEQWLELKQQNRNIGEYLESCGYRKIAIYGMGKLGKRFLDELEESDVKVDYVIDLNLCEQDSKFVVKRPNESMDEVDVIIVTAVNEYSDIKSKLMEQCNYKIISLTEVLSNMVKRNKG